MVGTLSFFSRAIKRITRPISMMTTERKRNHRIKTKISLIVNKIIAIAKFITTQAPKKYFNFL